MREKAKAEPTTTINIVLYEEAQAKKTNKINQLLNSTRVFKYPGDSSTFVTNVLCKNVAQSFLKGHS